MTLLHTTHVQPLQAVAHAFTDHNNQSLGAV
jgi:hypothetical protein